jgi:hypothetical protein
MTAGWKITATTLYCEDIGEDVTIMLYKDGTVKCTGANNTGNAGQAKAARLRDRSKEHGREMACLSPGPCAMTSCFDAEIRQLAQ